MSYTALYRKWRPTNFDEVKGQDVVCQTLKNQIKNDRIAHAYLFCGTRGTGKTSIAKIMAKAVNCPNAKDGNPCNECEVCVSISKENSINVLEIDAASNNGVDNIREIKEQVKYPPTWGKYRVFIVDEVHMLSSSAFNALLKTLEEPPAYVIFILATTEVHKIPITVLSRCQRYDFKRIEKEIIFDRLKELSLKENIQIEDKAITYISKLADGAMRDALSLLDECVAYYTNTTITYDNVLDIFGVVDFTIFNELFTCIVKSDIVLALKIIEDMVSNGRELTQFVLDFLWYLRNILIIKSTDEIYDIIDLNKETLDLMKEKSLITTKETLIRYIRIFSELANKMKFSNQKRVLLEVAIIKLATPIMEDNVDSLMDRISQIENNIKKGSYIIEKENTKSENTLEVKKEVNTDKVVTLDKMQYDDFMLLRKDWDMILGKLGLSIKPLFSGTYLETNESLEIFVVFSNSKNYGYANNETYIENIKQHIKDEYQKEFDLSLKLISNDEYKVNTKYVQKEELQDIIKGDVFCIEENED